MADNVFDDIDTPNVGSQGCIAQRPSIFDDPHSSPIFVPAPIIETLGDRGNEYGDYSNMSFVAQRIKESMQSGDSWSKLLAHQKESLDVIATKIARIVCGNPNNRDSWHDIQGYAKLAEDRIPVQPAATP